MQLHPNDWFARHARRILQERGARPAVRATLRELALAHADETRRLRALWTLSAVQGLDEATILAGLGNDSPLVRAWLVQLACEVGAPSAAALERFAQLAVNDPSPVVRLYLASACQRLPLAARPPILRGLLGHEEDSGDHNLPAMDWYALESVAAADPSAALALWPHIEISKLRSNLVRRIAQPAEAGALATLTTSLLGSESTNAAEAAPMQLLVLRAMNQALIAQRSLPAPAGWSAIHARLSASPNTEVRAEAMTLALTFGDPSATAARIAQLSDESAPLAMRKKRSPRCSSPARRRLRPRCNA